MPSRQFWLLIHRWGGLFMAVPLIIVALTGSIIAFTHEVNHLLTPERYATPRPGTAPLGFETLVAKIQASVSTDETILSLSFRPDQVTVRVTPRLEMTSKAEANSRQPYALYIDPWTGKELARQYPVDGKLVPDNRIMRFIHALHDHLYLGTEYMWVLGIIALLWTVDCFVSWYLTLPNSSKDFWRRWKPAWLIKSKASTYRLNYDLHRANGLWLWPILFVFAWSSVSLNLPEVYDPVTKALFEYNSLRDQREQLANQQKLLMEKFKAAPTEQQPGLTETLALAKRLAAEEGPKRGFSIGASVPVVSMNRRQGSRLVNVALRSNEARCQEDISEPQCAALLAFDGKTGELVEWRARWQDELQNEPTGNFVTRWMRILHFGQSLGLAYKIFVSVLGIVITVLTVTGIYIWWKKRVARLKQAARLTTQIP